MLERLVYTGKYYSVKFYSDSKSIMDIKVTFNVSHLLMVYQL